MLHLLFFDFTLVEIELILHLMAQIFLLLLGIVPQLNHFVDLLANFFVLLLQLVSLIRQLVTVVEERIVLLLCLDEAGDNFLDGRDSRRLLDLLKGILNNFHVTQVLVHQALLLAICGHDLRQA